MEIRCTELSVVVETQDGSNHSELLSIVNSIKNAVKKLTTKRIRTKKRLLNRVNAVFEPGTLTLVLGPSGSGKSTLLKVLSGQLPIEKNVIVEGDISYNGRSWKELLPKLPQLVAYVLQTGVHFPTLTVEETLQFANACCDTKVSNNADCIIDQLGLQNCRDTNIGNSLNRGISGGECRRVTLGETEFGMKNATCMDEISTGLDSATTFDIVSRQRDVAKTQQKTVVMSLLQPAPEVFELFDNTLLLNNGEVVYYGPRKQVLLYFHRLGLLCPMDRDVADFLLDIATEQQCQYELVRPESVLSSRPPRLGTEFAERFRRAVIAQRTIRALDAPWDSALLLEGKKQLATPEFRQSFWWSTLTLLRRQTTISFRNKKFVCVRGFMVVFGGLIYGTTFYQVDLTDIQVTMGIVYQTAIFLSVGQASEIPTFMAAREVYYKHRLANFYRASSFVIAYLTACMPVMVGECIIFGLMVYWMCGFVAEIGHFFLFLLSMILSSVALSGFFLLVSALSPNFDMAQPLSTISNIFVSAFAGFVVPMARIPNFFAWLYWINPVAWCLRSVIVNQYRSSRFDVCVHNGAIYCELFNVTIGEYLLTQYDVPSDESWVWSGVIYLVLVSIVIVGVVSFILEQIRYDSPACSTRVLNAMLCKKDKYNSLKFRIHSDRRSSQSVPTDYYLKLSSLQPISSEAKLPPSDSVVSIHETPTHFTPTALAFTNLWYTVTTKSKTVDLLQGVNGYALPGTMTALMGSSGAGKTTLLDVIAGRKTGGTIRGEVLLNGYRATDRALRRCTGYCEQQVAHAEGSTIREALTFSAFLRQDSSISTKAKLASVEECLDLLDLHSIADQIIRDRSQEQLKRLTIGVELAAQPSVLFLDEPTSGLNARSAKIIMEGVRRAANGKRTVICTIHQPSSDIFFLFDSLLLLKSGGEMVYFGELMNPWPDQRECGHLIDYFEGIRGVPRLPAGQNPATWMLECIGAGVTNLTDKLPNNGATTADFVLRFQQSREFLSLLRKLYQPGVAVPGSDQLTELLFDKKRAANAVVQLTALLRRFSGSYWRTPAYNLTRIVIALGLGLIFSLVLIDNDFTTYQGMNSAVGVILMTTLYLGNIAFNSVLPFTARDRASYYRERNSQTYNVVWYFVGSTLVEIPYAFATGLMFSLPFYPMLGFSSISTGLLYWMNISLFVLVETYLGQLLVYALPSLERATIVGVLFNSLFLLFSGFNPPGAAIPTAYKWCYYSHPIGFRFPFWWRLCLPSSMKM